MRGCLSLHARSHANRVLRFHAAPEQGERQQRPDDWRADHDEREDRTNAKPAERRACVVLALPEVSRGLPDPHLHPDLGSCPVRPDWVLVPVQAG